MIELHNLYDRPRFAGSMRLLAHGVTLTIPPGRYALLSSDATVNRHAVDLFCGTRPPESGKIIQRSRLSWPIARAGFVRGKATGYELVALLSRLYGLDQEVAMCFLTELLTDPNPLDDRIEHWSSTMRGEFAHAVALLPHFDCYVVDGVLPHGKNRFVHMWRALFSQRLANASLILSSSRLNELREWCDKAIVLDGGRIEIHDALEPALREYPLRPVQASQETVESQGVVDALF